MRTSNDNGRSLECQFAEALIQAGSRPIGETAAYQIRDILKLATLTPTVLNATSNGASRLRTWVIQTGGALSTSTIERLSDRADDVADVVVQWMNGRVLRISIKYNHAALKHPRPFSLAQGCGIPKGDPLDQAHRNDLRDACNPLVLAAQRTKCYKFADFPIEKQLVYEQVVAVCSRSLNLWGVSRPLAARSLFDFVVGHDFYKAIVSPDSTEPVILQDFHRLTLPTSLMSTTEGTYLAIQFNNSWRVQMRIHNASSQIPTNPNRQVSLKFDAQLAHGTVNEQKI